MPPSSMSYAAIANGLKVQYPDGFEPALYDESDIFKWIPKDPSYSGSSRQYNPIIDGSQGSNVFGDALNYRGSPTLPKFNVTHVRRFGIGSIDNEAVLASRDKKGALAEMTKIQVDSVLYGFARAGAQQLVGGAGGGAKALTKATGWTVGGTTIALNDIKDHIWFEKGQVLQSATTDGTSGSVNPGHVTVAGVARDTGILTLTAAANAGIPTIAVSNYLFGIGDFGTSLSGVLAWIPPTAPGATSFFGVDRTQDLARLSGTRTGATGPIEDQIGHALTLLHENGGKCDTLWMHTRRGWELQQSIHGKTVYGAGGVQVAARNMDGKASTKIFLTGFVFQGPKGPVTVLTDPGFPYAYAWGCRREDWELFSMGPAPHFDLGNGGKFFIETSAPAKQFRMEAFWQLGCKKPVNNVMHTFA